jgi:parvulin-like peptidyl-prolyl isomerase
MKTLFTLTIACALSLSAQNQTTAPAPAPGATKPQIQVTPGAAPNTFQVNIGAAKPTPISQLPADRVVATVNGEKITAGQLQVIIRNVPSQFEPKIEGDRKEFVTQYSRMVRLVDMAQKDKLDLQSPYKEAIAYQTMVVLSRAAVEHKRAEFKVSPEDVKAFYAGNQERYSQIKFKAIYLPFNTASASQADSSGKALPTEGEAKAKAEDLVKQARAGADFVKLVKENSGDPTSVAKDGDFPPVHKGDKHFPPEIAKALFSGKVGDVTEPVRQGTGFYIFRIQEVATQPLDEVQVAINDELRNQQVTKWLEELNKSIEVKLAEEPAPPAAAPVPSASAAPSPK